MSEVFSQVLLKQQQIKAATDLKGVPEGTQGQVMLSNGLDWVRYWVKFENGIEMGSLHRNKLVLLENWEKFLEDREAGSLVVDGDTDSSSEEETESGSGSGVKVNGVLIPQFLLDRSKAALERF